VVAVKLTCIML